jgi:ArsR family transcriptional regulator
MNVPLILRALANERRLQVLDWLRDPRVHFPPQVDGDLVEDGVCGALIAAKLGVGAPTLSEHMRVLTAAGLVVPKRIKQWTMYRRDEERIAAAKRAIEEVL